MEWRPRVIRWLELEMGTARFTGVTAVARILLYLPPFYIVCVFLFTPIPYGRALIPFITYALLMCIGYGHLKAIMSRVARRAPSEAPL